MENKNLFIPIILGTAREGRKSEHAARFVLFQAQKYDFETELVDVRDFRIEATDNTEESQTAKRFEKIVSGADGYIIVSPEYNHGYPGELKMMLDMLFKQFAKKPAGICGVSSGPLGGARMMEELRLVMIAFHMVPVGNAVYFSGVSKLFDESGVIQDPSYEKKVGGLIDEVVWFAKALKSAREAK